MIDRERALAIQQRAMRDFVGTMLGSSAPGSSAHERDGFTASVVPACPERSLVNAVAFTDGEGLLAELEDVAAVYDRAGIAAWTVWVPDFDQDTISGLEAAGHSFDGKPAQMVLELDRFEPRDVGDLEWDADGNGAVAAALNDLAYGHPEGEGTASAFASPPARVVQYRALVSGEVACALSAIDHEDDLGVYFVATHPDHRGKGLATRLMVVALTEARERGLRTSSLQASPMGEPIYLGLGYERCYRLHLYERRRAT